MDDNSFAIFVLLMLLAILFALVVLIFRWIRRHDTMIDLSVLEDGTFKSKVARYRIQTMQSKKVLTEVKVFGWFPVRTYEKVEKTWLFPMLDLAGKHPFPLDYERLRRFFVAVESNPIMGVKRIANVKKIWLPHPTDENGADMVNYIAWIPVIDDKEPSIAIDDYTYSWVLKRKVEAYEKRKKNTTAEIMERIVIPSMLIILVIILLIFLPKIIDKLREPGLRLLDQKLDTWFTAIRGSPPPG